MSTEYQERLKSTGRNDTCPCGSEKKYKKCHLAEDQGAQHAAHAVEAARIAAAALAEKEAEEDGEDSAKVKATSGGHKSDRSRQSTKGPGQRGAGTAKNMPRRSAI